MSLTATGLVVLRGADYLQLIQGEYERLTGLTVDWDRDLFLGNITAIMADRLGDLGQLEQALYDARDLNNANDVQLDQIATFFGLVRIPATPSTVTVMFTGTPGTVIADGTIVAGGGLDGLARWSTLTSVTIPVGGTVTVIAQALVNGRTTAAIGAVNIIATPRTGVDSVISVASAIPGTDIETDAQLRSRVRTAQQGTSAGTPQAIRRAMLDLPDVQQAVVIENTSNSAATVLGILLNPHSVGIVVYPEQDTTDKKSAIALAIYDDGPRAGIETIGTQSAVVVGEDGINKTVKWNHATVENVPIVMTLSLASGYTVASVTPSITALIASRSALQLIGAPVKYNSVLCDILSVDGVDDVLSLTLDGVSADFVTDALEIAELEITGIS